MAKTIKQTRVTDVFEVSPFLCEKVFSKIIIRMKRKSKIRTDIGQVVKGQRVKILYVWSFPVTL